MRTLEINKQPMVALNYLGEFDVFDEQGYRTGEKELRYSEEMSFKANISGAKGSAYAEMFGLEIKYDKTIVISKQLMLELKIDENTVFFIDKKPEYDGEDMPVYDYKVKKIADALNNVAIALEKVRR